MSGLAQVIQQFADMLSVALEREYGSLGEVGMQHDEPQVTDLEGEIYLHHLSKQAGTELIAAIPCGGQVIEGRTEMEGGGLLQSLLSINLGHDMG